MPRKRRSVMLPLEGPFRPRPAQRPGRLGLRRGVLAATVVASSLLLASAWLMLGSI